VERSSRPQDANVSRLDGARNPAPLRFQEPEPGYTRLFFRTEVEEKQEEPSQKPQKPRKKAKVEEAADSAEAESETSSSGEDSEEEHTPFAQAGFLAEVDVKDRLGTEMCIEFAAPRELDSKLVERFITFHHGDGWDVGHVKREVDPNNTAPNGGVRWLFTSS